jgi:hypothetical protein
VLTPKRTRPVRYRRLQAPLALSIVLATVTAGLLGVQAPAQAADDQHGLEQVVLNPGGGTASEGQDGVRIVLNASAHRMGVPAPAASDQIWFANTIQYCCLTGAGPHLNVGGTLFGESGASGGGRSWSSVAVVGTSGAAATGLPSTTGDATAHLRYTAVKNGRTYTVDRRVAYTFPNHYFRDTYTFTIPAGNTDPVRFYSGGDTSPGSGTEGFGVGLTSPVRSVISVNPGSGKQVGQREVSGSTPFDGATAGHFDEPYDTVAEGGDIGFAVAASEHDTGFMTQWNLGSTPGTRIRAQETFVGLQGTTVSAAFRASEVAAGAPVLLDVSLLNSTRTQVTGVGYTFTLPAGMEIAGGARTSDCGGTLSANGHVVTLSGGTVPLATNCVASVPVSAPAGTYTIDRSSVSGLAVATNGVGSSTLKVTAPSTPVVPPAPTTPEPPALPGAPTGVTATPERSAVLVSWQAPATGSPAVTYRVTADPGSASCETTGLSCVLGGVAGTTYTFTVTPYAAGGVAGTPATVRTGVAVEAPAIGGAAPETPLTLTTDRGLITKASPGEEITVIGDGFLPFSTVTIVIHSTPTMLGQVTTDADGAFSQAVVVPADLEVGEHSLVAYGVDPDGEPHLLRMDVTVAAAETEAAGEAAEGGLPVTGQNVQPLTYVAVAGGLLAVGFLLVLGGRTRRRT